MNRNKISKQLHNKILSKINPNIVNSSMQLVNRAGTIIAEEVDTNNHLIYVIKNGNVITTEYAENVQVIYRGKLDIERKKFGRDIDKK